MTTPERRREEARELLDMLEGYDELMSQEDRRFYEATRQRFEEFGDRTSVSLRQLFWLRDLKDRYAL